MIYFLQASKNRIIAVQSEIQQSPLVFDKLIWLLGDAKLIQEQLVNGNFIGPRKEMVTPWSTNAVEITQNMGIAGIIRMEEYSKTTKEERIFDPMLQAIYINLDQRLFDIYHNP